MKDSRIAVVACFALLLAAGQSAVSGDDIVVGSIDSQVESQIDDEINDQIDNEVAEQIDDQVDDVVDEVVEAVVEEQVDDIVVGGIQSDIDDQVEDEINDQINDQLDDQVDEQTADIVDDQVDQQVDETVAEQVDQQVQDDVEEQIAADVEEQVDEEIADQVDVAVQEQVDDEVEVAVEEQVQDQVDDQVDSAVEESVDVAVTEQVDDEVDEQVQNEIQDQVAGTVDEQVSDMVGDEIAESASDVFDDIDLVDISFDDVDRYVDAYREPKIPEAILVLAPQSAIEAAEALGLELESRNVLGNLGMVLGKISPYEARRIASSAPELAAQLEHLDSDKNHLYRQYALSSNEDEGSDDAFTPTELVKDLGFKAPLRTSASVGMIDSQVNTSHPCLKDGQVEQKSLIPENRQPSEGHGTAVASILAGSQGCANSGLLEQAKVFNASVFYDAGEGEPVADAESLLLGIDWLLGQNVSLINMSFSGPPNKLLERAIDVLAMRGVPVFAAVGNDGPLAPPRYPAAYEKTIAVTAVDHRHSVYRMAGRGGHVTFAAPGVKVRVAAAEGSGIQSGTSLAAPMAAAFYLGELENDTRSADSVIDHLRRDAIDLGATGLDETYGYGLVKLNSAERSPPRLAVSGTL